MKKYLKLKKLFPKWAWLLFVVMILFVAQLSAQNIERLDDKFANDPDGSQLLKELVTSINPSVYVENGNLKAFGDGLPVVLYLESGGFTPLYAENELFSEVKLITVKVNNPADMQNRLSLDRLQGFNSLEYILILVTYDACGNGSDSCVANQVQSMISGTTENPVLILYELSIPN